MPSYKLIYFNNKGRAEGVRYLFALAAADYEDKRVTSDEWKDLKPNLGQLPVLEVDGKQISQSKAIARFVAAELGFYGENNWERAQIDVVLETADDASPAVTAIFGEKDEAKKEKLKEELHTEKYPKVLDNLEKLLKQNGGGDGWFVGKKVSLAEVSFFAMYNDFYTLLTGKPMDLSKHEKLAALLKRFKELPQIAEWIKKRPETPF